MKIAKQAGVEIIIPDKTLFAEKSASVVQDFIQNYPEMAPVVNQIKNH